MSLVQHSQKRRLRHDNCRCAGMESCHGTFLPPGYTSGADAHACARALRCDSFARRGIQQPDLATVAHVKRTYVTGLPALPLLQGLPPVSSTRVDFAPGSGHGTPTPTPGATPTSPQLAAAEPPGTPRAASAAAQPPSSTFWSGMGVGVSPSAESPQLRTDLQRFLLMRQSLGHRLANGKSCIHGTGVFARVAHKAGDWLIEYAGAPCPIPTSLLFAHFQV